jgi:hypothetical protein
LLLLLDLPPGQPLNCRIQIDVDLHGRCDEETYFAATVIQYDSTLVDRAVVQTNAAYGRGLTDQSESSDAAGPGAAA